LQLDKSSEAGHWKMKIIIEYGDERAEVLDHLMVANPQPMLLAYWKLMTFPPMIIILFIINQWMRRKTVRRLIE
jgi:ATP/ADP translocase